jgi:acetyl/propionyl-CoA carboxylase alpha subunit
MYEFEQENGNKLQVDKQDNLWTYNGVKINFDNVQIQGDEVLFFVENKLHRAGLLEFHKSDKTITISLNGITYKLNIKDKYDSLLAQLGLSGMAAKKVNELKSPMPGLVVEVLVKEGDIVKKGSPLVILEAMKMENVLKAAADVIIKKISIEKGKAVEKNQVLIVFE